MSQQGTNVFHVADELNRQNRSSEDFLFTGDVHEYFVHNPRHTDSPDMFADACKIHQNCDRIPLETFLSDQEGGKIVSSNLYNINRIFNETEKNLIQNIILSSSNNMKIRFHHTIKEFGDATGWCHSHGLAWRNSSEADISEIHKLIFNGCRTLTNEQLSRFAIFCNQVVSVSLDPVTILERFSDLSQRRAEDVANIVKEVNIHHCTNKCKSKEEIDECAKYRYPRCPATWTLISRPPPIDDKRLSDEFLAKTKVVKEKVRKELKRLKTIGGLNSTPLIDVLTISLGEVWQTVHDGVLRYEVVGEEFPEDGQIQDFIFNSPYNSDLAVLHGLYMYCLAFDKVHKVVIERKVSEAYVVQYEPHIIEALRANSSMEIITYNMNSNVFDYVTKRSISNKDEAERVAKDLDRLGHNEKARHIMRTATDHREITQSEAFFRIDSSLSLASSNLHVVFVNTRAPERRSRNYQKTENLDDLGLTIEGREGKYKAGENIIDKYMLRPDNLYLLVLKQFAMNYVLGTPMQQTSWRNKFSLHEEIPKSKVRIAVSNDDRQGEDLFLPEGILLKNGLYMVKTKTPAVVKIPSFTSAHDQEYSDLLLYTSWSSEELDLQDALIDMVDCSTMHQRIDREPMIGPDGTALTKIETIKASLITLGINKMNFLPNKLF